MKSKMTSTDALQIRVKTSFLAKDDKELHKKAMEEVKYNGGFDDTKQVAVGKTTQEDKQKIIKGSMSTEEKRLEAINITDECDYNSSDDDDSLGGSYDEADSEDYNISDDEDDDGLINNKADGLADLDEFRRNNPSDADIYYRGWDGLFVPELEEGGTLVLPPCFVLE